MNIRLIFDYGIDIIEIPDMKNYRVEKLREKFDEWCYDEDNSITFDKNRGVFCFAGETFVDWLNNVENIPSKMLDSNKSNDDESLFSLYF